MRRLLARPTALAAVVLLAAGIIAVILLQPSSPSARPTAPGASAPGTTVSATRSAPTSTQLSSLPAPPGGFAIPKPHQLRGARNVTRWAPVLHATEAYSSPDATSSAVVPVAAQTPEGTANLVDAIGETTRDGAVWVHARLAVLPDGRTGWIPRTALGGWSFVNTRLVVDRATLQMTLYRGDRAIFRTPVGIGKASTPTPAGVFYVRDKLTAYASPEYGPLAFGTSDRSPYLTDWPAGAFIGIHGTDEPGLIPGRISHGCIRLRNSAILALGRLLPVGTPVIIR